MMTANAIRIIRLISFCVLNVLMVRFLPPYKIGPGVWKSNQKFDHHSLRSSLQVHLYGFLGSIPSKSSNVFFLFEKSHLVILKIPFPPLRCSLMAFTKAFALTGLESIFLTRSLTIGAHDLKNVYLKLSHYFLQG